jgi:enterochelin esterase-like enzyme
MHAGGRVSFHVLLPRDYEREPERRFPVLYWLHGSGGGGAGVPVLARSFVDAMERGSMPSAIVVFPNGLANGMYCDWKDGTVLGERVFIDDLVPHIDASFRTIAAREGRIIEGFSMGGYGAGRLGFKYPDRFCAVSMLAAGPVQRDFTYAPRGERMREALLAQVYGSDLGYFREVSPWHLAEVHAPELRGAVSIRMAVGDRDETLPANEALHAHLDSLGIPHVFTVLPGLGHDPRGVLSAMGDERWAWYRRIWSQDG